MTSIKVGVASYEAIKERTLAIARGEHVPGPDDPTVWFTSAESMAKVLSDRNRALLRLIAETSPQSIDELAKTSGRAKSNLSRTLKTMARYGFVSLHKGTRGRVAPVVEVDRIRVEFDLTAATGPQHAG
ncbi:MAG: helix-turn-helix domain-containing protein [Oceanicaulis sp.]